MSDQKANGSTLPAVFTFGETNKVRIINKDDKPWFHASDVCSILEIGDTRRAVERLDDDEKMKQLGVKLQVETKLNNKSWFVNESGLYNLIFRSNKPEAKQFRKWVTNVVLPVIRMRGYYGVAPFATVTLKGREWVCEYDYCKAIEKSRQSFYARKYFYPTEYMCIHGTWYMSSDLFNLVLMQNKAKNKRAELAERTTTYQLNFSKLL